MSVKDEARFLETARKRFDLAVDAEKEIRTAALRDLKFLTGDQWENGEDVARKRAQRPALTINKLPPFVDQIVNQQRQYRPAGKVSAVGDGADEKTADILQGLIRHIEYNSQAEGAYDTAFDAGVSNSFGYWRYSTEYVDDRSLDQEIRVERVADPFTVYMDPAARELDGSDAIWAFVVEDLTREEFKRQYPRSDAATTNFFELGGNVAANWIREDGVRIAEYWQVELDPAELTMYRAPDYGPTPGLIRGLYEDEPVPRGYTVLTDQEGKPRSRTVERRRVCRYDINGAEILKQPDGSTEIEWAGRWIPIVRFVGKEKYVDGTRKLFSAIRWALDPQQLYNFYKTSEAEVVQVTPKAPYVGAVGQFRTMGAKWATANVVPYAYLEYDPVAIGGQPAPPPQRQMYTPVTQALAMGAREASDDMKATTGLFDASRGEANANADSGKAIGLLQQQGDTATYHFFDNFLKSMWHGYRIMLDLIPKIYDAPRVVRIVKPDDQTEMVAINQQFMHDGKPANYDLAAGRYDVVMTVGPSYKTRKEQNATQLAGLAKADPQSLPQWADLFVKTLDLGPLGDEIADRLTPPQFKKNDQQNPQQIQQVAQQLHQQNQQLTQALHEASQALETKQVEQQARIEMTRMQEETKLKLAEYERATRLMLGEIAAKNQTGERREADAFAAMQAHEAQAHDVAMQAQQSADQQRAAAMAQQQSGQQQGEPEGDEGQQLPQAA